MNVEMLNNQSGKTSFMRVISAAVILIIMIVWGILSWKNGKMIEIPETLVAIIASLLAGKVGEKFVEQKY